MERPDVLIGIDASRSLSPHPTGTETYSRRLIAALLELDGSHRFRLYYRSLPPAQASPQAEARVIRMPRLWTHLGLSWEMLRRRPDLLFVPSHVLPLLRPSLSLVTIHDLGYLHFPRAHPLLQRTYLDLSTRWNARVATHLLADSAATKKDLVEYYRVPEDKVTVAYLGYDDSLAPVTDRAAIDEVKGQYGIEGRYFIYMGTLQPRKNLSRLISALVASEADIRLVLAGRKGWLYEDLFAQVRGLGLGQRIHFTGYIPPEDKAPLLSGAEAFLFPSLYEGFGLPVLEAQACGCPVICSNTSSIPEVAGEGALYVDPNDTAAWAQAMGRLVHDATLRDELVGLGTANLNRFSWQDCARTVLRVMDNLVASRG